MKKFLATVLVLMLAAVPFAGCGAPAPAASSAAPAASSEAAPAASSAAAPASSAAASTEKPYIAVVSKGFQHQFWQTVMKGSQDAAAKYNVDMTFEGPPSESDIGPQVDMVNAALAKNPKALCLAALDTKALDTQINQAKAAGIPIVGFDSGIPGAPDGAVVATASTNNYAAGELAATEMFKAPAIAEKLKTATKDAPITIAVHAQDATSESLVNRTKGFLDKFAALADGMYAGGVEIKGHDVYKKPATGDVVVILEVTVPPSTSASDSQSSAQTILQNTKNLIGYYCPNAGTVDGLLAATNDGTDLDKTNGKYKDLTVIGFDAGATQKNAVKNKYFYGSITQDPYMIGFLAVELAVKSINGEAVEKVVDTGCKFYNSENMDQADIAQLLYD